MEDKPGYYAIIPAKVRYDKEISPNAKLLYGEVTAFLNFKGICFASNSYFSRLFEISETQVSRLLNQLIEKGYIHSEMQTTNTGLRRVLMLGGLTKNDNTPLTKNVKGGLTKNVKHNKESINNQSLFDNKDAVPEVSNTSALKQQKFLEMFNGATGHKIRVLDDKGKKQFFARLRDGYQPADFKKAITSAFKDMTERGTVKHLMPEFITRPAEFAKYLNMKESVQTTFVTIDHSK